MGENFFQKFFTNIICLPLNPLLGCQNVIYGGDTEGGGGHYVMFPWGGGSNMEGGGGIIK